MFFGALGSGLQVLPSTGIEEMQGHPEDLTIGYKDFFHPETEQYESFWGLQALRV